MKPILAAFAALELLTGALLWLAPGLFYQEVGPFGPRNDHYMGDLATWYLALGALVLVAVRRREWRVPVLGLALLQNTLHAFNHLLDVGEADPAWLGPATLVSLVLLSGLVALMLTAPRRRPRTRHRHCHHPD
jgi:peptidoglycan/LPS O-acetylase OafA/YrhL